MGQTRRQGQGRGSSSRRSEQTAMSWARGIVRSLACRHEFVVVETLEFFDDEDDELPAPLTLKDIINMNKVGGWGKGGKGGLPGPARAAVRTGPSCALLVPPRTLPVPQAREYQEAEERRAQEAKKAAAEKAAQVSAPGPAASTTMPRRPQRRTPFSHADANATRLC